MCVCAGRGEGTDIQTIASGSPKVQNVCNVKNTEVQVKFMGMARGVEGKNTPGFEGNMRDGNFPKSLSFHTDI